MKKIMLMCGIVLYMAGAAEAQRVPLKSSARKNATTIMDTKQTTKGENASTEVSTLSHTGNWNAFSNNAIGTRSYLISDSTVRTLNKRAYGADNRTSIEDVMGVNKRRFGIANGHMLFRTNSTTTSGTNTGSGAVGTGSSPAGLGALGPAMGVNGTSPKARTGMNTFPATIVPTDVIQPVVPAKKTTDKKSPKH